MELPLNINGEVVYENNLSTYITSGSIAYEANTLTLTNAVLVGGIEFTGGDLNIVLNGDNNIIDDDITGIKVTNGSLNISGNGNLNVTGYHGIEVVTPNSINLNTTGKLIVRGVYHNPVAGFQPDTNSILFYTPGNHGQGIIGAVIITSGELDVFSVYGNAVSGSVNASNNAIITASSTYGTAFSTGATTSNSAKITATSEYNYVISGAVTLNGGSITATTVNGPYALEASHFAHCSNPKMDYGQTEASATIGEDHIGNSRQRGEKYVKIYCTPGEVIPDPSYVIEANKTADKTSIKEGEEVTFTVTITNPNEVNLNNIIISDTLFSKINDKTDISLKVGASVLEASLYEWQSNNTLKILTINAKEVLTITYSYTYTTNATSVNSNIVTVTAPNPDDNTKPAITDSATEDVTVEKPTYNLDVKKEASGDIYAGEGVLYTVTITNKSSVALNDIVITDTFFNTITDKAGIILTSNEMMLDESRYTWDNTQKTLTIDTMAVNEIISVLYMVSHNPNQTQIVNNTVTATAPNPFNPDYPEIEGTDNTNVTVVKPTYDLDVVKEVSTQTAYQGDEVMYKVTVTNKSSVALDSIAITDTIFSEITDKSDIILKLNGNTLNGGFAWDINSVLIIDAMQANDVITIEYSFIYNKAGKVTNMASAIAPDPFNPANPNIEGEDSIEKDIIEPTYALDVVKSVSDETAYEGEDVTYTVKVTNNSSVPLENVIISDTVFDEILDKDAVFITEDNLPLDSSSYSWDNTVHILTLNKMDAGETVTIIYKVSYETDVKITVNNEVSVTAPTPFGPDTQITDKDETEKDINIKPSLFINKEASGEVAYVGYPITYTIKVENTGSVPFLEASITDSAFEFISKEKLTIKSPTKDLVLDTDYEWDGNILKIFNIPENTVLTITYTYTPTVAGNYINNVSIIAKDPTNPENDLSEEDTETTEVLKAPSIKIEKTTNLLTTNVNTPINYTIKVENDGGIKLESINITDTVFSLGIPTDLVVKNNIRTFNLGVDYIWNGDILVLNEIFANEIITITYTYTHDTIEKFDNIANVVTKNPLNPSEDLNDSDNKEVDVTAVPIATPTPTQEPPAPPAATPTPVPTTAPPVIPPIPVLPTDEPAETPAPTDEVITTQEPTVTNAPQITPVPEAEVNPDGSVDIDKLPDEEPSDVLVDGDSIDPDSYEVEDGTVTINPEVFENLDDGEHLVEIQYENEESVITQIITDQGVPLSAKVLENAWSLFDLVMTIITFILMFLYILSKPKKDEDENQEEKSEEENEKAKKRKLHQLLTMVVALISLILLVITQDFTLPMTIFDKYSIAFFVIGIIQLLIVVLFKKSINDEEERKNLN